MPRKRNPSRKIGNHTKEQMEDALKLIEEGKKIREVAREKHIPFSTLRRYAKKLESQVIEDIRLVPHYDVHKVFSDAQEQSLKEYLKYCALLFYGLSTTDCRKLAYEMAAKNKLEMPSSWIKNEIAGIDWLKSFRKRHSDLSLRKPEACSLARATAFNREKVKIFFDNLKNVLERNPALADGTRIYNLDETATTTVQKPQKVIGPKGRKNLGKVTSGEKGTLVTTTCIISASGQALPPVIIFPRKNYKEHMIKGAPAGSLGLATPTGWMNTDLFSETMKHFIKHSNSSKDNPSVLIMDNHESHLSIEALDLAKTSGVIVVTLPPHCSAKLQPLDVGVFAPFKNFYNSAMESWMLVHPGKPVSIYDIAEIVGTAFSRAMTPTNIINAFAKTGIYPYDKDIFTDEDFLPSSVTDRPCPASQDQAPLQPGPFPNNYQDENSIPIRDVTNQILDHSEHKNQIPAPSKDCTNHIQSSVQTQPGTSRTSSLIEGDFLSPHNFRDPIKAGPRNITRKPRKVGRSIIATDTPEKEKIEIERRAVKKRKLANTNKKGNRKGVRKVLQSDSEDDGILIPSRDENEYSGSFDDDEEEIPLTVNKLLLKKPLLREPREEDYVLVDFSSKRQNIYCVGRVLHARNEKMEYYISFLRKNQKNQFKMPNVPDLSYVEECNIKLILPKPGVGGSTKRQQSYYHFNVDFSQMNIR